MVAPETVDPLTFHRYAGFVPPLTGVAVKVTEAPAQAGLADAAIDTLTGSIGLTVMVATLVGNGPPHVPDAFCICLK